MEIDNLYSWKIIICGEGFVGKTSLIETYRRGEFFAGTTETIAVQFHILNFFLKTSELRSQRQKNQITVQIWDLGGQERYYDMNVYGKYTQDADLAVCCFDASDLNTLEKISKWLEILPKDIPRMLVGLKTDLLPDKFFIDDIKEIVEEDYQSPMSFVSLHLFSNHHIDKVNAFFQEVIQLLCKQEGLEQVHPDMIIRRNGLNSNGRH
ncbi:MAG: ADP-ribosylation factor-like protein [Candidatus Hodarchaeota archaeon]